MFKSFMVLITACCIAASVPAFAQPAKSKTVKPVAVKKVDYEKMKEEIRSLYRGEKYKEVIVKATLYLAKYPKDTTVTFQKAASHVSLKQSKMGFDMVRKFFTNTDTAAKYLSFMAFGVPEKEIKTSGMLCAEEAIKMAPAGPWGYFVKAGIFSDAGEHEKALADMETMYKNLRNDDEKLMLGSFYPKELAFNKQDDKALDVIDGLNKKFPGDAEILNVYAFIYRHNKQYDKAVEKYDELIKLYPADEDYKLRKAAALFEGGKTADACATAETLITIDSSYDFLRFRYKCPAFFASPAISDIKKATWAVSASGNNYDFEASNLNGSLDSDFEFDWNMSSSTDANGHVKITKNALEKATAQNNYFGPSMKNVTFTDKTTVWVSKAVINNLLTTSACKMDLGGGEEEFTLVLNTPDERDEDVFETKINVKGEAKYISTLHVKNADGTHQVWIMNDAKNPMIVKMQLDWDITLKSIE
jgi:tetratricopeptide (TPR) repeat protein